MTNSNHHEPLQALGPIAWEDVPYDTDLATFLSSIFAEAQTLVESIPSPTPATVGDASAQGGRARAQTDSVAASPEIQRSLALLKKPDAIALAQRLRQDWKEVKINAKDNSLEIAVHKLSAKDGKGAWFARRSVHEGLTFDEWRAGLGKEFAETMKVQEGPGSGNIRGIGAERAVEHHVAEKTGQADVFQLSAQFPGPTAPRDFITLLLTGEQTFQQSPDSPQLRQYMVVSKPCKHPDCPPRQGIIRGQYESVEIIREVPNEVPNENNSTPRTMSQADLSSHQEPMKTSTAIEWLMITRSDPGGSVPRFLIEKGTPPGIVGDAGKFLKWITSQSQKESSPAQDEVFPASDKDVHSAKETNDALSQPARSQGASASANHEDHDEGIPSSNGLYGMITGAFGAAGSIVANSIRAPFESTGSNASSSDTLPGHHDDDHASLSDTSSVRSFASALEKSLTKDTKNPETSSDNKSETHKSDDSKSQRLTPQEKELKKLQERRRKLDEKTQKMQEHMNSKRQGDKEKDAAAVAKLREKHEREIAKQEEKYRREVKRLEEKREHEERKAEERRRKTAEREEKANMSLELEKTRAERDVALKEIDLLEKQVGELQAQNTALVAKLGKSSSNVALSQEPSAASSQNLQLRSSNTAPITS